MSLLLLCNEEHIICQYRTAALYEFSPLESKQRGSRGGPASLTGQEQIGSPEVQEMPTVARACVWGEGKVTCYESVPMPRTSRLGRWWNEQSHGHVERPGFGSSLDTSWLGRLSKPHL